MSIKELSDEQIHTMSLQEKDQWWFKNVYKGDMPQLNLRSALSGMILGSILCLTNLYVGIRTGWTLGVGITSVILSYALFKTFARFKIGDEMSILENNAMQSIATSAGYMTSPLMASIPAYMMVTGEVIPMWRTYIWAVCLCLLGVFFAFPLKKKYINDDQLPFPEGRAAGIVLDNLHEGSGDDGMLKAKILGAGALIAAIIETMRNEKIMEMIKLKFLTLPEYWDDLVYKVFTPTLLGTPLKDLTIHFETSIVMMGTGGLMNINTAMSMMLGGLLNYFILVPSMIQSGVISTVTYKSIVMWSMWGGAACMTTSSLFSFFSKPEIILEAFKKLRGTQEKKQDPLEKIELPMWVSGVGVLGMGTIIVLLAHEWFHVEYWMAALAIPLVFVFTIIAVTSTGLTAITPGGALSKLTQITYGVLAPGNVPVNLLSAGITTEVSLSASNLLMDIKPGYMLGGKPRHQAIGHVLGCFAGGLVAVPVFYLIFHNDISLFTSAKMPMPGAMVWKGVSEVLAKGISNLHPSSQVAVAVGALFGIVCEVLQRKTKGKFPISGVGFGLAFLLPFYNTLAMAMGSFIFWWFGKRCTDKNSRGYKIMVENQETLAAGVIAGGSIIGIVLIILENTVLS